MFSYYLFRDSSGNMKNIVSVNNINVAQYHIMQGSFVGMRAFVIQNIVYLYNQMINTLHLISGT